MPAPSPATAPARRLLADVAADEPAAELARDRRAAIGLEVGDDDLRALAGQHPGRALAEAGSAAGDDEYLALDLHGNLLYASAASARAVISSTLPVPSILR